MSDPAWEGRGGKWSEFGVKWGSDEGTEVHWRMSLVGRGVPLLPPVPGKGEVEPNLALCSFFPRSAGKNDFHGKLRQTLI